MAVLNIQAIMTTQNLALLPNGLSDLLYPDAEKEAHIIETAMSTFKSFGYQRVKPPLVEFEDSLLAPGPGQALARNTFRLMDPVSQRMMGVRADVTTQIARIATSRLSDEQRPLRLSYAGDVLRVNGTQLRPERQFCQVGCELIGTKSAQDIAETCLIAIKALSNVGVQEISIDLTIPTLLRGILKNLDDDIYADITNLIQKRDRDALASRPEKQMSVLVDLIDTVAPADKAIDALQTLKLDDKAKQEIQNLKAVYDSLNEALHVYGLQNTGITVDPLEQRGFEYQTGVSFTLFAKGLRGELGRGGHYEINRNGESENACGFTLYMDSLLRGVSNCENRDIQKVSENASWQDIKDVQDKGTKVSRG